MIVTVLVLFEAVVLPDSREVALLPLLAAGLPAPDAFAELVVVLVGVIVVVVRVAREQRGAVLPLLAWPGCCVLPSCCQTSSLLVGVMVVVLLEFLVLVGVMVVVLLEALVLVLVLLS